jgi:amino acid adenylation domain-containing protein
MTLSSKAKASVVDGCDRSVLGLLAAQCRSGPDAVAVVDGSVRWTYADLHSAERVMVDELVGRGMGPGSAVGVCLPRSKEAIAAMVGIWQAGAVYVPLDPNYPISVLDDMCERAGVGLLVGRPNILSRLRSGATRFDASRIVPDVSSAVGSEHPGLCPDPDSAAYILFTSGSSGRPKAVQVPHRGLTSVLDWIGSMLSPEELAVSATSTSFSFDPCILEVLGPLTTGGTVHVISSALDLSDAGTGVTFFASTPSVVGELFRAGRLPPNLKALIVGGEVLPPALATALLSWSSDLRLWNCYGPTECTVLATSHEVTLPVGDPVPIGRNIPGATVILLDERMREVLTGQTGEICIFGPQVADGYRADPKATAERFMDWTGEDGHSVRIYRTGDMGRRNADGSIAFAGRRDRQLKLRGYRIEVDEVEMTLCRHPSVIQAFVTTADHALYQVLVAYVTISDVDVTAAGLRDWLRDRLPHFMVPSKIIVLESFPTTVNGKVDEDALLRWQPIGEVDGTLVSTNHIDTSGSVESVVAALARQVLKHPAPIQPEDDLLEDLGASSLVLFRLLAAMEETFSCRLSIGRILEDTTIAGLAKLVGSESDAPTHLSVNRNGRKLPIYLVHAYLGTSLRYRSLGPFLSDRPLVGIQVQEFGSRTRPIRTSVEQMVDEAVDQIRSLQPRGPYLLGGHSAGGLVAYEAARRLVASGEDVPLLVVLDSPMLRSSVHYFWTEVVLNWPDIRSASGRERVGQLRDLVRRRMSRFRVGPSADRITAAITHSYRASNLAVKNYKPGPYGGAMGVLRTGQGETMALGRNDLGWGKVAAGPLTIIRIPGLHNTIFEVPHVEIVGRELDRLLGELDVDLASEVHASGGAGSEQVQPDP